MQADIPLCGAIAHAAFAPSPLIQTISPASDDLALAFWSAVVQSALDDPNAYLVVAEDTSPSSSGSPPALVGFAKWVYVPEGAEVPGIFTAATTGAGAGTGTGAGPESEGDRQGVDNLTQTGKGEEDIWGMVKNPELARTYFGRQHDRHEKYMGRRRHWYLELIATKREVKGSGAGRKLVQWGVEKVDADGCQAYLEASPEGKGLFERFGFRVVERLVYLDGSYLECCMIRGGKGERE
jgi:ribosomal protein S18 acetylase RimI-like enzyme